LLHRGTIRTYSIAFLAVDKLIDKAGVPAGLQYLKSGNFEESFQISRDEFVGDLERELRETTQQVQTSFTVQRAYWKIGDRWRYARKRVGNTTPIAKVVIGEDTYLGIPSYVVRAAGNDYLYAKESVGLVARINGKEFLYRVSHIDRLISWPLETGKQWRNTYSRQTAEADAIRFIDHLMVVPGVEEIAVPAGKMKAVKLEAYSYDRGRLMAEYWYAPEAKWFAKSRIYDRDEGLVEEDLLSFQLN
jgi:hypothetical protein